MPSPAPFASTGCRRAAVRSLARLLLSGAMLVVLTATARPQVSDEPNPPADSAAAPAATTPQTRKQAVLREVLAITAADALPADFVLEETKDNRGEATRKGERRIIRYNREVAEQLGHKENRWIARMLLAHEVGHHVLGHAMQQLDPVQLAERELLADRYSGKAIARLGGTIDLLKGGFLTYDETGKGGYPQREDRLAAGRSGWLSVAVPKESFTLAEVEAPKVVSSVWRKEGSSCTEYIDNQSTRLFDERKRDDEHMTLVRVDAGSDDGDGDPEVLLIPLVNGEARSRNPDSENQVFRTVALAKWVTNPGPAKPAAAPANPVPELAAVPVACGTASHCAATREEKIAVNAIENGRWQRTDIANHPADWFVRSHPSEGLTTILPASATLLARHNFKVTVGTGTGPMTHAELRAARKDNTDLTLVVPEPPLLPPTPPQATPDGDGAAAGGDGLDNLKWATPADLGMEDAAAQPPGAGAARRAHADGNYVSFRYIAYLGGKRCAGDEPPATCTKPVAREAYVPIKAVANNWSANTEYALLDEATAGARDPIFTATLRCSARKTLSMEAFSAACQVLWEAMTNHATWPKTAIAGLASVSFPPPPPPSLP